MSERGAADAHRKIVINGTIALFLSIILVSSNLSMVLPTAATASSAPSTPPVNVNSYLKYQETVAITWNSQGWTNQTVGDVTTRVTVTEVQADNFTVREDINYTMYIPDDLLSASINIKYQDGSCQNLASGTAQTLGSEYAVATHVQYVVNKTDGQILHVWRDEKTDVAAKIPLRLEFYWSYSNVTAHSQEYAWDVLQLAEAGENWGYSVEPNLQQGHSFDGWTVASVDVATVKFDGVDHACMNLSRPRSETHEQWAEAKLCDTDTGIKLRQMWRGDCHLTAWNADTASWTYTPSFSLTATQELALTNLKLTTSTIPPPPLPGMPRIPWVVILQPKQSEIVRDRVLVDVQADSSVTEVNFYVKPSSYEGWVLWATKKPTTIDQNVLGTRTGVTFRCDIDFDAVVALYQAIDPDKWRETKWQIRAYTGDYRPSPSAAARPIEDIVDIYLKPIYISAVTADLLDQSDNGPHTQGGLDRVPYSVTFDLKVREKPLAGQVTILIDCWYLPLTDPNFDAYVGGTTAEKILFKTLYADEAANDPIVGKIAHTYTTVGLQTFVSGGHYLDFDAYNYTQQNGDSGTATQDAVPQGAAETLLVETGDVLTFESTLFFQNPQDQFRLFSFDILLNYTLPMEGETTTFIDHAQKTIGARSTPLIDPSGVTASNVFFNLWMGTVIEGYFGKDVAAHAYEGNYLNYLYYPAGWIDTAIVWSGTAVTVFGIIGGLAAGGTAGAIAASSGIASLATGVPLPLDLDPIGLISDFITSAYQLVSKETRVEIWFQLLQYSMGLEATKLIDAGFYNLWAGIYKTTSQGDPYYSTLEVDFFVYQDKLLPGQTDTDYQLEARVSYPGSSEYSVDGVTYSIGHPYSPGVPQEAWSNMPAGSRDPARFLRFRIKGWSSVYTHIEYWPDYFSTSYKTLNEVASVTLTKWEWHSSQQEYVEVDTKIGEDYDSYWLFDAHFVTDFDTNEPLWSNEFRVSQAHASALLDGSGDQPWYLWGGYFRVPIVSDIITALSPVEIHVYDQYGRHVGLNASGGLDLEIPGAWYAGSDGGPTTILLSNDTLAYRYEVVGEEAGEYKLGIMRSMNVTDSTGEAITCLMEVFHAPTKTSAGEVHTYQYDFEELTDQINNLTSHGWAIEDAVNRLIYEIDADNDGAPDVVDPYPLINKAPAITLTHPEDGATVAGRVTFEGAAWDPDGNQTLQRVETRVDAGAWVTATGTSTWSFDWNTDEAANGPATIEARAWDGTHYSPSSYITLTILNPTAVWTHWWFWTMLILAIGLAMTIYLLTTGKISLPFKRVPLR